MHTPLDWQLLSGCQSPLLLASSKQRQKGGNVLATVDLRNSDRKHTRLNLRVLDAGQLFAQIKGCDLHVVNALELGVLVGDLDLPDLRKVQSKVREDAKLKLKQMLQPYAIPLRKRHVPVGKVGQAVVETVEKVGADLVVVGTSAHRHLGRLLIGGSAEKILARTTCDVLAVHPT